VERRTRDSSDSMDALHARKAGRYVGIAFAALLAIAAITNPSAESERSRVSESSFGPNMA
jgi:hypothetical protein